MHLDQKVSLKSLNTFGIEARARYFVEAKTHSEVLTLLNYRHMIHMPILFLGGGSNVLFTGDFQGIVIKISSRGIVIREENEHEVVVTAEAGETWDDFVALCVNNGWAGLENLSLIPGTVGAAPIQNIGAYGVEVKDRIVSVQVAEIDSGRQKRYENADCMFGYRDSVFKRMLQGKVIILNVTFRLQKVNDTIESGLKAPDENGIAGASYLNLEYGGIKDELRAMGVEAATPVDVREAVCAIRRRKLPDPAVTGNAGSFFKNPVVALNTLYTLQREFPAVPYYPVDPGQDNTAGSAKIPAAWLIEQCGWKGYRSGDAGVHPNQPLVLVNYGNATGKEILSLAKQIEDSVVQKFGIRLEPEVCIVG